MDGGITPPEWDKGACGDAINLKSPINFMAYWEFWDGLLGSHP